MRRVGARNLVRGSPDGTPGALAGGRSKPTTTRRFVQMRTARSLTSILFFGAAATSLLTACPDGEEAKISFAQAPAAQRAAVVPAALGLTGEQAANLVTLAEIDHAADAACPTRNLVGTTVVYEAQGCEGK